MGVHHSGMGQELASWLGHSCEGSAHLGAQNADVHVCRAPSRDRKPALRQPVTSRMSPNHRNRRHSRSTAGRAGFRPRGSRLLATVCHPSRVAECTDSRTVGFLVGPLPCGMAHAHGRPAHGGRANARCADPGLAHRSVYSWRLAAGVPRDSHRLHRAVAAGEHSRGRTRAARLVWRCRRRSRRRSPRPAACAAARRARRPLGGSAVPQSTSHADNGCRGNVTQGTRG